MKLLEYLEEVMCNQGSKAGASPDNISPDPHAVVGTILD